MRQRCCLVSFSIFVIFTLLQTKLIRRIALKGADVTIVFMPEEKVDAEETLRDINEKSKGRSKVALAAFDSRDELNCGTLVEMHLNERGKLDVLYVSDIEATYGRSQHGLLQYSQPSTEQWRDTFHTDIHSFFHVVRAALQHMTQGCSIVFDAGVNPSKEARRLYCNVMRNHWFRPGAERSDCW